MEEELNYLSEKIESVEHQIDIIEYGIDIGCAAGDRLKEFQHEKQLLENILNALTISELNK